MTLIILDAASASKLQTATGPVELCDTSGKVLGQFIPATESSQRGPLEPQISEEEIQRRRQLKGPGYTTAEVLARLEELRRKQ